MSEIRIWLAAFVASQAEIAVRDAVRNEGYEALLPTAMVEVSHARKTMLKERPVFPRYLFIGIPHGMSWYPLKAIPGILGVLSASGKPREVPPSTMKMLAEAMEVDAFTEQKRPAFEEGQRVLVNVGSAALEAFVGRIKDTLPGQRIEIVFRSAGKEHRSKVMVDQVRAA